MNKITALAVILALLLGFTACEKKAQNYGEKETVKQEIFRVETDFRHHFEKSGYYCDVIMPKIAEGVADGEEINQQLAGYSKDKLIANDAWLADSPANSYKLYYNVSRKDGFCSLNLIREVLKEGGDAANPEDYIVGSVLSYYYNENAKKGMTQNEYLKAVGYTKEGILNEFNKKFNNQYTNRTYGYVDLIYWFDEQNQLQFCTANIDNMDCNTADFSLTVNGKKYEFAVLADEVSPFGAPIKKEKEYSSEVWAGSWWIKESYNGAYVLYLSDEKSGKKYPYHVELTRPNDDNLQVFTYRHAAIGDTREQILKRYPEIDPLEQEQRNGTKDLLQLEGNGGYLYLEFYLTDNIVTKITAGVLID